MHLRVHLLTVKSRMVFGENYMQLKLAQKYMQISKLLFVRLLDAKSFRPFGGGCRVI